MAPPEAVERVFSIPGKDRLDKELCEALHISREKAKRLIVTERIRIAGATRHHPARRLGRGASVELLAPPSGSSAREPVSLSAWSVDILYEDEHVLAVNKPAGLPVHEGAGHDRDTLVEWLRAKSIPLAGGSEPSRAGLVHRLDKETSGVILLAKDNVTSEALMKQFADRTIEKEYLAAVQGRAPRRPLTIVGAIARNPTDRKTFGVRRGGRDAVTVIESIDTAGNASFIRALPKTGRTHQIRVHLKHAGFPIIGDQVYGVRNAPGVRRMLLHAHRIRFIHPVTGKKMDCAAPLPPEFAEALRHLGFSRIPASH